MKMGKRRKSLKQSLCCEGMHFGRKTGCIEKMFVKLEMTRASPGRSLVIHILGHLFWMKVNIDFSISNALCMPVSICQTMIPGSVNVLG